MAGAGIGLFYGVAGLMHLTHPEPFFRIMPDFVPMPDIVVTLTGLAELSGAAGLQIAALRRAAGLASRSMLSASGGELEACARRLAGRRAAGDLVVPWPRLAAQPLLILAALHAGGWRIRLPAVEHAPDVTDITETLWTCTLRRISV